MLLSLILSWASMSSGTMAWSYHDAASGPSKWPDTYSACGFNAQSPINIVEAKALTDETLSKIKFIGTPTNSPVVVNNGHTVSIKNLGADLVIELQGTTYKLASFHFHWGTPGSEHNLDGNAYPAEAHLVHYNSKYKSLEEAMPESDGLAVLGVFLNADSKENNGIFDCITSAIQSLITPAGEIDIVCKDNVDAYKLLPKNLENFSYQGSLTTPPCYQSVKWVVFKHPVGVSSEFLDSLAKLKDHEGVPITNNFRPLQELNGRKIYKSF